MSPFSLLQQNNIFCRTQLLSVVCVCETASKEAPASYSSLAVLGLVSAAFRVLRPPPPLRTRTTSKRSRARGVIPHRRHSPLKVCSTTNFPKRRIIDDVIQNSLDGPSNPHHRRRVLHANLFAVCTRRERGSRSQQQRTTDLCYNHSSRAKAPLYIAEIVNWKFISPEIVCLVNFSKKRRLVCGRGGGGSTTATGPPTHPASSLVSPRPESRHGVNLP